MTTFDGEWHCYTERRVSNQLEPHGGFHFVVNPVTGELITGSMHNDTAITGNVNLALQSIEIHANDPEAGPIRYLGSVVFQGVVSGLPRVVTVGRFILESPEEDQLDGVWVITKP
jgi:hypothetical protein